MATLAIDSYDRANNATLGANWIANTGDFGIVSNQARGTVDDSLSSYDGGVSWPNDQWSQATLATNVGDANNNGTGTTVRGSGSAGTDSAYEAYCSTVGTRYYKSVAGAFTQLGSDDTGVTWAAGNICYLEMQGTTLLAKRGGSAGTAATSTTGDTTFASGKPGIQYGHGGTTCDINDWSGGDFSAAAATAIAITRSRFFPGKSPGYPPQSARFYQSPRATNAAAANPDVTVGLTGVAATSAVGTLAPGTTVAITGAAGTGAVGAVTPATSVPITGTAGTSAAGTLAPSTTVALTGNAGTSAVGTVGVNHSQALTGNSDTSAVGTLAPSTTIGLTGVSATGSVGSVNVGGDVTIAITGVGGTASVGTLGPQSTLATTGVTATSGLGTLAPATSVALSGVQGTSATGLVGVIVGGDISVALTGVGALSTVGSLSPSGADSAQGFSGGFLYEYERHSKAREDRRRRQQQLEEDSLAIPDAVDSEIATLLHQQEAEDERRTELARLNRAVIDFAKERIDIPDRVQIAYVRALTQANFSALEALDRELQRMLEEEDVAALMLLLNQ